MARSDAPAPNSPMATKSANTASAARCEDHRIRARTRENSNHCVALSRGSPRLSGEDERSAPEACRESWYPNGVRVLPARPLVEAVAPYQVRDGGWRSRLLHCAPLGGVESALPNARSVPADICLTRSSWRVCYVNGKHQSRKASKSYIGATIPHPLLKSPSPAEVPIPCGRAHPLLYAGVSSVLRAGEAERGKPSRSLHEAGTGNGSLLPFPIPCGSPQPLLKSPAPALCRGPLGAPSERGSRAAPCQARGGS